MDSSLSSATSSSVGGGVSSPEHTLATFIFHCVGAAISKLHQIVFSPAHGGGSGAPSSVPTDDSSSTATDTGGADAGHTFLVWLVKVTLL